MYVKTHLCTSVYKWPCTVTLVLKRHALLDADLFWHSALAEIVQLPEWSKHKSSRSNLTKDNCFFSDANCCAEIKDYRLILAGLSVGDFLCIMTEIGPVYCEIRCQNCFVRTKYHFDSNVCFFFCLPAEPYFVQAVNYGDFIYFFFREIAMEYNTMGKVSTVFFFCNCLSPNQRWLPIYWENQEVPGEANRIWVYHIMGRRLLGAVKWPKHILAILNRIRDLK